MNNQEENFGHGAIPLNKFHRFLHRKINRTKVAKGLPFDWTIGYDVRDIIGQIAIKNQGTNDSCGGQSGSYFLEIQRRLQKINEGEASAKSIYSPIAYEGGGTTVDMLEKQIGANGCNLESEVSSYDVNGNPLSEYLIADKSWITPQLLTEALGRAGYTPYDIPRDIDSVASSIEACGAIIWEIQGQNNGTWSSAYPQPPISSNSNPLWNHFMCIIGAKMINGQKTLIGLQSMGSNWGQGGIQYFTQNYFDSGHIVDCFTFFFDKGLIPNPDNQSLWAVITRWFRWYWKLS